jgi:multidrug efflux pump subunit AcrA (membrane-fusion protein)
MNRRFVAATLVVTAAWACAASAGAAHERPEQSLRPTPGTECVHPPDGDAVVRCALAAAPARVPGRIIDVKAKEGDRVRAGQTVAVLESPELARTRAALAAASARARSARLNAERLASLEAKNLASGQEVSTAAAEASALEAEVTAPG